MVYLAFLPTQASTIRKVVKPLALLLGSIALCLTLSRTAIIIWGFLSVSWIAVSIFHAHPSAHHKKNFLLITLIGGGIFVVLAFFSLFNWLFGIQALIMRFAQTSLSDESVIKRQELLVSAIIIIKNHPFFGVGLGNFLPTLSHTQEMGLFTSRTIITNLQPVHNILLLWTAETGLIGLDFLIYFLTTTYRKLTLEIKQNPLALPSLIALSTLLFLGFFDHYPLTLQQGQLLTTLILSLSWLKKEPVQRQVS
jgi:O-antigen ligase